MIDRVYLKDGEWSEPDESYYFMVARNGAFAVKRTAVLYATKPVDLAAELDLKEQEERVKWLAPKVPAAIIARAVTFLRIVVERQGTEAFMFLLYSSGTREYQLAVPGQCTTSVSVRITEPPPSEDGWLVVGTIHSHPGSAFHSHVDAHDEAKADGLHIVVGRLASAQPDISCCIVAFGRRCDWPPSDVIENPFDVEPVWLKKVQRA